MADESLVEWQSFCSKEQFAQLHTDVRFQRLVTLARIVNSIRFLETAVIDREDVTSPAGVRQRASGYLFLAAVLQEALDFADRLGEHFSAWPEFREGLGTLLSDQKCKTMRRTVLDKLRDKAVYHHDDETVALGLTSMAGDEYVFYSGRGLTRGQAYYDLADVAIFQYALDLPADVGQFGQRLDALLTDLIETATAFAAASDGLIAAGIRSFGLSLRRGAT